MSCERLGDDFFLLWDSDPTPVVDCHGATIGYGNYTSPVWVPQVSIGDMGLDFGVEQPEIPLRIETKVYKPGRADWAFTFSPNYNAKVPPELVDPAAQTFFDRLLVMIGAKGVIHMALADGRTFNPTGNAPEFNYWHAWWCVTGNLNAPLDNAATKDVEARVHHWRGQNDNELPEFVPQGATPGGAGTLVAGTGMPGPPPIGG